MSNKIEMRELTGGDIFTMLGILGKLDIKDEVVELLERQYGSDNSVISLQDHKKKKSTQAEQASQERAVEKRGMLLLVDIGFAILRHVGDAKQDINAFLADLTGLSVAEIGKLSMIAYTGLLIDFSKKAELKDFFQSIASLLG